MSLQKPQTVPNLPQGEAGMLTGTFSLAAMLETDETGCVFNRHSRFGEGCLPMA